MENPQSASYAIDIRMVNLLQRISEICNHTHKYTNICQAQARQIYAHTVGHRENETEKKRSKRTESGDICRGKEKSTHSERNTRSGRTKSDSHKMDVSNVSLADGLI